MKIKSVLVMSLSLLMTTNGAGAMNNGKCITQIHPFVPQAFESLDKYDQGHKSKQPYQQALAWFDTVTDVEFFKMEYLSDGLKVIGIIAKPKDSAGKKLPVVIYNRGGSNDSGKITVQQLQRDIYFLAQNGYVVLAPQYRGNDGGQGRDELGGSDVHDVDNFITAAHELEYADPTKLYMVGFSRGGMQALMVMRHRHDIKAAALMSAVYDLFYFEKDRPDMIEVLKGIIRYTPENMQEEYIKRSATRWAQDITTPLLMLHGEKDTIVHVREAQVLSEKMKQHGKTHAVMYYAEGDHYLVEQRPDINQKILAWFSSWV